MKTFHTAAALAGLALATGCTTALAQGLNIQGDLPAVQEREVAQAAAAAECVVGRHQFIGDYIASNRVAAAAALALQAVGLATQPTPILIPTQVPRQTSSDGND
jgi:hypothetical protein